MLWKKLRAGTETAAVEKLFTGLGSCVLSSQAAKPTFRRDGIAHSWLQSRPTDMPKDKSDLDVPESRLSPQMTLGCVTLTIKTKTLSVCEKVKDSPFTYSKHFCLQLPAELQLSVVFSIGTP